MTDSLEHQLVGIKRDFDWLPEAKEPLSTPYGLDYALLEYILSAFSDGGNLGLSFSRLDLADVQVRKEITISNGQRSDAVVWASEDWFGKGTTGLE